ncbi:MAG: hypothetical protein M1834_001157 [Cirrosporium novae-zelandiae]|nr:MAG: hypothetical protein M1834_001157 [Cirrosporium novae-zelandiae]
MWFRLSSPVALVAEISLLSQALASSIPRPSIQFLGPLSCESNGISNIHIKYLGPLNGDLSIHYGSCEYSESTPDTHHIVGTTVVGDHPLAKRHDTWRDRRPEKFVWIVPDNVQDSGCLHAYSNGRLIGSSEPIAMKKRMARRSTAFADIADAEGPWFDGVQYLKEKEPGSVFVAQAKSKSIGIIGGGMSGLMSSLLLDSVGIHNWKIIEASGRVGGRVHTSYLNGTTPDQYQYQEMGPMRFPVSIKYSGTNDTLEIKDHRMVFQLAAKLNEMNNYDESLAVNFIKWIQSSANEPVDTDKRRPDGTVPGAAEVSANPSLATDDTAGYSNATITAMDNAEDAYDDWVGLDEDKMRSLATNIFRAHKQAVEDGLFDFSESGYLRYKLAVDLNITDMVDSTADVNPSWPYENVYFSATNWRTIDKGLSRLPEAFHPFVLNRTILNTTVSEMSWDNTTEKMTVKWRTDPFSLNTSSLTFDYVITAVPFSKVRLWRLPTYSSLLSRAIDTLNYEQACKVALHYKTRFWEHLDYPIYGGCGSTDIPGIGSICYPSYKINSTGPGVILASYNSGTYARTLGSMTEAEHVGLVQRAMIEVHGSVAAEQWTGNYDRICWENNEYQAGAWCSPMVNQQQLYLPAYFHTELHTVFVGEHTSFTHAWIWSALESAIRGTSQLLLDMGLVDEAKNVTTEWMARWMNV